MVTDLRKRSSDPRRDPAAPAIEANGKDSAAVEGGARGLQPGPAAASGAGSPPARRARRDRGAETRQRLVEAAVDIFGRFGFEGASTRQIVNQAETNLAAIAYHFGSKEALHIAAAEHIATRIATLVGPVLVSADSPQVFASPKAARAAFIRIIEAFADTILGEKEAERWARFIVREQMQPTQAFEVIYRFTGAAHNLGTRLAAAALGENESDATVSLRVFALFGQVLVFRVAQALVMRRMEWQSIGEAERTKIKRLIVGHIDAIFDAERSAP
jgi:TetR/AcrR family transcriptional regulator, regulator of cefoperazone and chloramphenicol sensitivity